MDRYDVIVMGGGPAGVCAALSAARSGVRTLLITDRPVLGGNSSSEVRVWTRGAVGGGNLLAEEMGIWGELKLLNLYRNPDGNVLDWDEVLLDQVLKQENLQLLLNTMVMDVRIDAGGCVEAVGTYGIRTQKAQTFQAKMFLDCTGDGTIAMKCGVPIRTGREGKADFGESLALENPDAYTQGCSILIQSKRLDRPSPYIAPEYVHTLPEIECMIGHGGRVVKAEMQGSDCWWFEYGGQMDIIGDDQEITIGLKRIALGIWNYIKNSGKFDADCLSLEWIGSMAGRRGSRRLVGEGVLVQEDVTKGLQMERAVAYGGWYMDTHPSGGIQSKKAQCKQLAVHCYGIPLDCFFNTKIPNLMFAGRCASMSNVAYSSARIMNTCAMMGQAIGTAAALCASTGKTPHDLSRSALPALRRRLALEGALLDAVVPVQGAEMMEANASSVLQARAESTGELLPLNQPGFVMFPSVPGQEVQIHLVCAEDTELSWRAETCPLPSRRTDINSLPHTLRLSRGAQVLTLPCEDVGFTILRLEEAPLVSLMGGTPLPAVEAGYCMEAEIFHPCVTLSHAGHYAPGCVLDGYLRPWKGVHAWVSGGMAPEGEWLRLGWGTAMKLESLLLFFDVDFSMELTSSRCEPWDSHHHYAARKGMPETLVRDYDVIAHTEQGDKVIVKCRGNIQRRNEHAFGPVTCSGVTLHVQATYGGNAVVYAMLPNVEYDR